MLNLEDCKGHSIIFLLSLSCLSPFYQAQMHSASACSSRSCAPPCKHQSSIRHLELLNPGKRQEWGWSPCAIFKLNINCNYYSFQLPCTSEWRIANYIQLMPCRVSVICSSRDNSPEVSHKHALLSSYKTFWRCLCTHHRRDCTFNYLIAWNFWSWKSDKFSLNLWLKFLYAL